jgi:hypothetical protein
VADVRDAPDSPLLVRCDLSWKKSHATAFYGVTRPSVVRPDAADDVPAVLRSRRVGCRHRPACGRRMLGCDVPTVPVLGASRRGPGAIGLKRFTWTEST